MTNVNAMKDECKELKGKIDSLDEFMNGSYDFGELERAEQVDMINQYWHMVGYLSILERRILRAIAQ